MTVTILYPILEYALLQSFPIFWRVSSWVLNACEFLPGEWARKFYLVRESLWVIYLVSKLVSYDNNNSLFVAFWWHHRIVQHGRLPVGDQSPVLHGPRSKVRDSNHVWNQSVQLKLVILKNRHYLFNKSCKVEHPLIKGYIVGNVNLVYDFPLYLCQFIDSIKILL